MGSNTIDKTYKNIKPISYISDGRGRDYYIKYNNGGLNKNAFMLNGTLNNGTNNKRYYNTK
jgi:hypothetical protein